MTRPATIADLTVHGVKRAEAECMKCRHRADIDLLAMPPDAIFGRIKRRLRCSACGSRDVTLMPDWRDAPAQGRI